MPIPETDCVVQLLCHPGYSGAPAHALFVEVARRACMLKLVYTVRGDIRHLRVPERCTPARTDKLWMHTCFEAFIRSSTTAGYWEFNLSPSCQWAAYWFDGYREGMARESAVTDPHIEVRSANSELQLSARLDMSGQAVLPASENWQLGLSAILENEAGDKSYWALAHPLGKADFHHPDSFVLAVAPAKRCSS